MADEHKDGEWYYVKNWWKYQHYRKRRPPWIKLYRGTQTDPAFQSLSEIDQWRLVRLWLDASEIEGRLPRDPAYIGRRLRLYHLQSSVNLLARLESIGLISQQDIRGDKGRFVSERAPQRQRQRQSTETEKNKNKNVPAEKAPAPPGSGLKLATEYAHKSFQKNYRSKPSWGPGAYKAIAALFGRMPDLTSEEFSRRWDNFMGSDDKFIADQGGSLMFFCSKFDSFLKGPIGGSHDDGRRKRTIEGVSRFLENSGALAGDLRRDDRTRDQ